MTSKPFYLSITIISAIVSGLAQLAGLFHVNISDLIPQITIAVGDQIRATVAIAGVVGAIYGRIRATSTIQPLGSTPTRNILLLVLAAGSVWTLFGCASNGTVSTTASSNIQNALLTTANVIQELNTGVQDVAPTVSKILTMTHNQGDAAAVNNVINDSAAGQAALTTLLANVSTAIASASTPAQQQAAISAAVSPTAVAAIVAPIAAGTVASVPVTTPN